MICLVGDNVDEGKDCLVTAEIKRMKFEAWDRAEEMMGLNMNQGSRQGFRDEQTDYFFM